MRDTKNYTVWDNVTPKAITSSTDATPIVVTATSHGFSDGDLVMINGHTTNVAANGTFKVANKTDNTFEITDRYTGEDVAGSGAGAGSSGVAVAAPKILFVSDFRNVVLTVITAGSSNKTIKFAGSVGIPLGDATTHGDTPNFGATASRTNPYSFVQIIDLQDATTIDGDTGIVNAGTDSNSNYEVNTNAIKYLCPIITAWSAGSVTITALLTNNQ